MNGAQNIEQHVASLRAKIENWVTLAQSNVSKELKEDAYGEVMNSLLALRRRVM